MVVNPFADLEPGHLRRPLGAWRLAVTLFNGALEKKDLSQVSMSQNGRNRYVS